MFIRSDSAVEAPRSRPSRIAKTPVNVEAVNQPLMLSPQRSARKYDKVPGLFADIVKEFFHILTR